jgi:hypothetical protein
MYFSLLFAAAGASARRSRSMRICTDDNSGSGHNAILSDDFGFSGSRRHASMIRRRFDCEAAGRRRNSTDAK